MGQVTLKIRNDKTGWIVERESDFDVAVSGMDNDIREAVHSDLAPWDYTKGKNPCRPVKIYARPRITEEPIPNPRPESCKGCIAEGTCTIDQQFVCSRKYYCKPAATGER
jgi:hypothetical protein